MNKKTRWHKYFFVLVLVASFLWGCPLGAQDYPKGTIQVVVPFAPETMLDTIEQTYKDLMH